MTAGAVVIVLAGMRASAGILVPFLLSVFLAVLLAPFFLRLKRWLPTPIAFLLLMSLIVAFCVLSVQIVGGSLHDLEENVPKYEARLQERIEFVFTWLEEHDIEVPEEATAAFEPEFAMRYFGEIASTVSGILTQAFLVLLFLVFLMFEGLILPKKIRALVDPSDDAWTRLRQIVKDVRRYMGMKTAMSLFTGALVAAWQAILDVDYPIILGLLAFVLNYIPNIGSFVAAIPGVFLSFILFGPSIAAINALGYLVINVAVSNFIEPRVMGEGLGLSPVVVIVSVVFWGWILGPLGMLLSVPMTMTVKIVLESEDRTRWIAHLLGSKVPETPRQPATARRTSRSASP